MMHSNSMCREQGIMVTTEGVNMGYERLKIFCKIQIIKSCGKDESLYWNSLTEVNHDLGD